MDAALYSSSGLLVAGLGLLLRSDAFARNLGTDIPLRDIGVFSKNEGLVWERIVVVAGLALAISGSLRLLGLS